MALACCVAANFSLELEGVGHVAVCVIADGPLGASELT